MTVDVTQEISVSGRDLVKPSSHLYPYLWVSIPDNQSITSGRMVYMKWFRTVQIIYGKRKTYDDRLRFRVMDTTLTKC